MTSTTVCPALEENRIRLDEHTVWYRCGSRNWAKRSRIDYGDRLGMDGDGAQRQHSGHRYEGFHREGRVGQDEEQRWWPSEEERDRAATFGCCECGARLPSLCQLLRVLNSTLARNVP